MDKKYWHSVQNSLLVGSKSASYNAMQDDKYPCLFQVGAPSPHPHPHPSLVWFCEMIQIIIFSLTAQFCAVTHCLFQNNGKFIRVKE